MNRETPASLLEQKQQQFNAAMEKYEHKTRFAVIGGLVSIVNVTFQLALLYAVLSHRIGILSQVLALSIAYVLADFINGLVHLLLDNSDNYESFSGPFVAAFHLHHRTPVYKKRNILLVYFNEAGSKIWLAFYFIGLAIVAGTVVMHPVLYYGLVYFGVFSCLAEVSHYCCHVPTSVLPRLLAKIRFLLPRRYHAQHHLADNNRYTFLNGFTDPLLNVIAKKYFAGYKTTTDLHYAKYTGQGTKNRE